MKIESPYKKHEQLLINSSYSAASAVQNFVLSCYNGHLAQFKGCDIRSFDENHFAIFLELATHYHAHGENDPELLRVGSAMWQKRKRWGENLQKELARHKAADPNAWEGGDAEDYHDTLQSLEQAELEMREKGWIS